MNRFGGLSNRGWLLVALAVMSRNTALAQNAAGDSVHLAPDRRATTPATYLTEPPEVPTRGTLIGAPAPSPFGHVSGTAYIIYRSEEDYDPSTPDVIDVLPGQSVTVTVTMIPTQDGIIVGGMGFLFEGDPIGDPVEIHNDELIVSQYTWDELFGDPSVWATLNTLPNPQAVHFFSGLPVPSNGIELAAFTVTGIEYGEETQLTNPQFFNGDLQPITLTAESAFFDVRVVEDCNENGIRDDIDIANGTSEDCNDNDLPDECEPPDDCNDNGVQDFCDIANGTSGDCNINGVPDDCEPDGDCNQNGVQDICDIADGNSEDCDDDGVPDECEPFDDCNDNGVFDGCDIENGTSRDCDDDGVPDECQVLEDCNENGVQDACDLEDGDSVDCNYNGIPDECEGPIFGNDCNGNDQPDKCDIHYGLSDDCDGDSLPDECQPGDDCNLNGTLDSCDINDGASADCNSNGVPDECDIVEGLSEDCDDNGIPDECEQQFAAIDAVVPAAQAVWDNLEANGVNGIRPTYDWDPSGIVDNFTIESGNTFISGLHVEIIDGTYPLGVPDTVHEAIRVQIFQLPGGGMYNLQWGVHQPVIDLTFTRASGAMVVTDSGIDLFGRDMLYVDVTGPHFALPPGDYAALLNFPGSGSVDSFIAWSDHSFTWNSTDAHPWGPTGHSHLQNQSDTAWRLTVIPDCNRNGIPDECEKLNGSTDDCNNDDLPDECEIDCNENEFPDECDIADGTSDDQNGNGVPDECE